jgi:hypothetical protein
VKRKRGRPQTLTPSKSTLHKRAQRRRKRILSDELDRDPFGALFHEIMLDDMWRRHPHDMDKSLKLVSDNFLKKLEQEVRIRRDADEQIERLWDADKFED